jgi:hypothetical protein
MYSPSLLNPPIAMSQTVVPLRTTRRSYTFPSQHLPLPLRQDNSRGLLCWPDVTLPPPAAHWGWIVGSSSCMLDHCWCLIGGKQLLLLLSGTRLRLCLRIPRVWWKDCCTCGWGWLWDRHNVLRVFEIM